MIYLVARRSNDQIIETATDLSVFTRGIRPHIDELLRFFADAVVRRKYIGEIAVEGLEVKAYVTTTSVMIVSQTTLLELCDYVDRLLRQSDLMDVHDVLKKSKEFNTRQEKTPALQNVKKVIVRNVEIDRLVEKSTNLPNRTKLFYRRVKNLNLNCFQRFQRFCIILCQ